APSGNSRAARWAICSRVRRGLSGTTFSIARSAVIVEPFRLHDAVHKNRRSHHTLRINGPDWHEFLDFGDGGVRGHGHDGIEISGGEPVGQVAQFVGFLLFDESVVRMPGHFQNAAFAVESAFLFAIGYFRADSDARVKALKARGGGTHAFTQNALRHQLERSEEHTS